MASVGWTSLRQPDPESESGSELARVPMAGPMGAHGGFRAMRRASQHQQKDHSDSPTSKSGFRSLSFTPEMSPELNPLEEVLHSIGSCDIGIPDEGNSALNGVSDIGSLSGFEKALSCPAGEQASRAASASLPKGLPSSPGLARRSKKVADVADSEQGSAQAWMVTVSPTRTVSLSSVETKLKSLAQPEQPEAAVPTQQGATVETVAPGPGRPSRALPRTRLESNLDDSGDALWVPCESFKRSRRTQHNRFMAEQLDLEASAIDMSTVALHASDFSLTQPFVAVPV